MGQHPKFWGCTWSRTGRENPLCFLQGPGIPRMKTAQEPGLSTARKSPSLPCLPPSPTPLGPLGISRKSKPHSCGATCACSPPSRHPSLGTPCSRGQRQPTGPGGALGPTVQPVGGIRVGINWDRGTGSTGGWPCCSPGRNPARSGAGGGSAQLEQQRS